MVREKWKWINPGNMEKVLRQNYGTLNFMILMATIRRRGKYSSKGKERALINMTKHIGTQVIPELMSTWSLTILKSASASLERELKEMLSKLDEELAKHTKELEENGGNVSEFLGECRSIYGRLLVQINAAIPEMVANVEKLSAVSEDLAERAVGYGFEEVLLNAVADAKGRGARDRVLEAICVSSKTMLPSICTRTVEHFMSSAEAKLTKALNDVSQQLKIMSDEAMRELREASVSASAKLQQKDRGKLAKKFAKIGVELEKFRY